MNTRDAARLIKGHRQGISRAIARQIQALVPRYRDMDATALERNTATVQAAVEDFLERGDEDRLLDLTRNVMQLRAVGGFALSEFMLASLCWLPVLRRFLLERAGSLDEGLRMYESVEAVALPLMARIADSYQQIGKELPEDPAHAFETFFRSVGKFVPLQIEQVRDEDIVEEK